MARALVPLDTIASRICSSMGDAGMTRKYEMLGYLVDAYKEFHLFVDHDFEVKTVILKPNHIIEMPRDFVFETKVGLLKNGRCAILTLDRNMPPANMNQTEIQQQLEDIWEGNYVDTFRYPFYNCNGYDNLYGLGCHLNRSGLYNINKKTGTIEIGSLSPDDAEVVIEYKSDGVSDGGLKLIPSEMVDVISYGGRERYYEAHENWNAAMKMGEKHKEKWYMAKRQLNFMSALYITEQAYNYTSEI